MSDIFLRPFLLYLLLFNTIFYSIPIFLLFTFSFFYFLQISNFCPSPYFLYRCQIDSYFFSLMLPLQSLFVFPRPPNAIFSFMFICSLILSFIDKRVKNFKLIFSLINMYLPLIHRRIPNECLSDNNDRKIRNKIKTLFTSDSSRTFSIARNAEYTSRIQKKNP